MTSRRAILWLLMLATAIAFDVVGPSMAQASCGDYLIGQRHAHSLPATSHAQADQMKPSSWPGHKTPCSGPGCQKAPTEPLSPVPAKVTTLDHDRLGCLGTVLPLPFADRPLFDVDREAELSWGHPLTIEHPPRT